MAASKRPDELFAYLRTISNRGEVFVPGATYLAGALGWSPQEAGDAFRDLLLARRIEPFPATARIYRLNEHGSKD